MVAFKSSRARAPRDVNARGSTPISQNNLSFPQSRCMFSATAYSFSRLGRSLRVLVLGAPNFGVIASVGAEADVPSVRVIDRRGAPTEPEPSAAPPLALVGQSRHRLSRPWRW